MTDDKGVGEGPLQRAPLRMAAYYYSFSPTGIYEIDRILSAAACAGKAFHNTDCWTEECEPYDGHVGDNPRDWIQNAANDCATVFNAIYGAGRKAERERCLSIVQAVMCVEDDLLNDIGKGIVKTIKTGGQDGEWGAV